MQDSELQVEHPQINLEYLCMAFKVMRENVFSSPAVTEANQYFLTCQKNPNFAFCLMKVFNQSNDPVLQAQALNLLKNVINRNWTLRRRTADNCYFKQELKSQIRIQIINLYQIHWARYYKTFNQILQIISRQDFPNNYPSLYQFIKNVMGTIAGFAMQQILASKELLPYLSTVKKVIKVYANKRITHQQEHYLQYIEPILQMAPTISEKIQIAYQQMLESQNIDLEMCNNLLECSRKIDKITMYGIQCATSEMQKNQLLTNILKMLVQKVNFLINFTRTDLQEQIQKNIQALIEGISKIQACFPFLISHVLEEYLQLIISMLFQMKFNSTQLLIVIIKANRKPFSTYSFYMAPQQFSSSLFCRKGNVSFYMKEQEYCHQVFMNTYRGANCNMMLEKIVSDLMVKYPRQNTDDQLIFQDADVTTQSSSDPVPFDLIIQLAREVLLRFKEDSKQFIGNVINHLLNTTQLSTSSPIILAMHEIVLLLPKITDESTLNLESIFAIMQKSYMNKDFIIFPRYIRNYQTYFMPDTLHKCFSILVSIISDSNMPHDIIYQSAVCIKKILNQNQEESLPIQSVGICLNNIFAIMVIYKKDPNHLWNLLNLLTQLMRAISNQTILQNIPLIMQNINAMIQSKDNTIVVLEAITDLLESVIEILANQKNQHTAQISFKSNSLCLKHIQQSFSVFMKDQEELGAQSLFRLWLLVIKNHEAVNSPQQFNEKLIQMFHNLRKYVVEEYPILFCEIVEEYMLSKLFNLSSQDMIQTFQMVKQDRLAQNEPRILLATYSIYYTYSLITNTYVPEIVAQIMHDLKSIVNKISPGENALRTELMLIISHHINAFGCQNIFGVFTANWPSYVDWFWSILWSLDLVNHRYACKVTSIALLNSLHYFDRSSLTSPIEGHFPIENILKFIVLNIEPLKSQQALNSYGNNLRIALNADNRMGSRIRRSANRNAMPARKICFHVNAQLSELNLTEMFKSKILPIIISMDWGPDDLQERFSESISNKITALLQ